MVTHYKELLVWQKAMDLADIVYDISRSFPKEEQYGMTSQIRRAVISIPSNLAEGHARSSTREFLQFIAIAKGSLAELETQALLAERWGYIEPEQLNDAMARSDEVNRMLTGLQKSLKEKL